VARLSDVAERAAVSTSVVSRVLRGDAALRVRDDTRARVLQAAEELGYTQNHAGRALRLRRSGVIAMLVPDVNNAIFAEMARGVEEGAGEADLLVLLGRSQWLEGRSGIAARLRQQGRIDGFVVQVRDEALPGAIEGMLPPGTPLVLVNTHLRSGPSSVAVDDEAAGAEATRLLVGIGHRAVGLVGGLPATSTARKREAGYRRALAEAGVRRREGWTTRLGYTPLSGREALRRLAEGVELPSALVVANLNAALGVLSAAADIGVAVPEQLSVVAIHDTWVGEHVTPALTTVRVPTYELGLEAARALWRAMGGGGREHLVVSVPAPIVVLRRSHAPGPFA